MNITINKNKLTIDDKELVPRLVRVVPLERTWSDEKCTNTCN